MEQVTSKGGKMSRRMKGKEEGTGFGQKSETREHLNTPGGPETVDNKGEIAP
jgi:hypothetical protein